MKWFVGVAVVVVLILGLGFLFGDKFANAKAKVAMDKVVETIMEEDPDLVVSYESADNNLIGLLSGETGVARNVVVESPDFEGGRMTIEAIDIGLYGENQNPNDLQDAEGKIQGLRLEFPEVQEALEEIGLSDLALDLDMKAVYDEEERTYDVQRCLISAEDLGVLDFKVKIGGIDADFAAKTQELESNPTLAMQMMGQITFHHIELGLEDQGLMERVYETITRESGESRDSMIEDFLAGMKDDDEFPTQFHEPIENFVRAPKRLVVSAYPSEPTGLMQIFMGSAMGSTTEQIMESLGVSITN